MQVKYLLKLIKTEPGFELSASRKRFLGRRRTLRCQWRLDPPQRGASREIAHWEGHRSSWPCRSFSKTR